MLESLRKVTFGPSSWALLSLLVGSVAELIGQWESTGVFPDASAWRTAILGVAFAGLRTLQAVFQTRADEATIPGGIQIDPEPNEPEGHA